MARESRIRQMSTPRLSLAEEREIGFRARDGDIDARHRLVTSNLGLVLTIARRYHRVEFELTDLFQAGVLGLVRAATDFNPDLGRFSTYAAHWIRSYLGRFFIEGGRLVHVPAQLAHTVRHWKAAVEQFTLREGRAPTPRERAALAQSSEHWSAVEHVDRVFDWYGAYGDQTGNGDGSTDGILAEFADPHDQNDQNARADAREEVELWLSFLDPRSATILRMRFGIGGYQPMTLRDIGEALHLTRERVRQLEARALRKVRTASAARNHSKEGTHVSAC